MRFIVTGFTPDTAFRVFAFEGIDADSARTEFTVRVDLSLIRRYGIHIQELPLLCRRLLERREDLEPEHNLTFTEADMCRHHSDCAAIKEAAAQKKARKPPSENAGAAWRTAPLHL